MWLLVLGTLLFPIHLMCTACVTPAALPERLCRTFPLWWIQLSETVSKSTFLSFRNGGVLEKRWPFPGRAHQLTVWYQTARPENMHISNTWTEKIIFSNICVNTNAYIHTITISDIWWHKFEGEWGGIKGGLRGRKGKGVRKFMKISKKKIKKPQQASRFWIFILFLSCGP